LGTCRIVSFVPYGDKGRCGKTVFYSVTSSARRRRLDQPLALTLRPLSRRLIR
jgi:hypothetical protein